MQVFVSEQPMPLTCGGCRHWGAVASFALPDNALAGRCGRFAEIRPGAARPRCNICWEPAVVAPSHEAAHADS